MSNCEGVETKCPDVTPAWVVTFADLMSLLLAFFVLLFSFSEMDKNVYKELAGSLKEAFGVQREIKAKESPRGINIIAREFSPGRPVPTALNEVRQMTTDENKLHPVFTDPAKDGQKNADVEESIKNNSIENNAVLSEQELEERKRIEHDSKLVREALHEEISTGVIEMEVTQKGIILRVREKGSFPSGSAEPIKPFKMIIERISTVFKEFDGTIIVSGHTDNVPINTYRFRSNWELSSSRAVSVIHELTKINALKDKNFKIVAYAETQPLDSNQSATGRAKNRRVEIMMDYSKKKSDKKPLKDNNILLNNEPVTNPKLKPENGS